MDSEKDLKSLEQPLDAEDEKPLVQLSKPRFVLVLVGLVLAIFLVCSITPSLHHNSLSCC
jgi:hypothetical protein